MSRAELTFISLYSGAGGLDLGFIDAGCKPIWANDIDPTAVATYQQNLGPHIAAGPIEELHLPRKSEVDLVIGGPPCQGFSVAGRMDPCDPRSRHVWVFMDIVDQVRPRAFVMENVKGLAVNRRWAELREALLCKANEIGYDTQLYLLNAAHYGVPQARERMFLIGMQGQRPAMPGPTTFAKMPTTRDVLLNLPPYGESGNDSLCVARVTPARRPVLRRSPFAGMLFNGKGRPLNLLAPAPTLAATMGGNRTPIVDQMQLENGGPCWVEGYHAKLWAGGRPIKRVPSRMRRLTVEEAAAIQTFPAGWAFSGTQSAQFRQIGNAVPPTLARHVAESVCRAISGSRKRSLSRQPAALAA